jgi:diketogulonate reductase-like aldo/keto reductase
MTKPWTTRLGVPVPPLGLGTFRMGESAEVRTQEIDAVRAGIEAGVFLIDTAESYAGGRAEEIVAEACHDVRDQLFVTTKIWPSNAARNRVAAQLDASLKRLRMDFVDLYLLHWPSAEFPLADTMAGLVEVLERGLARHIGVSNFPAALLQDADRLTDGRIFANQVRYGLATREAEVSLAAAAARLGVALMAYSPVRHVLAGDRPVHPALLRIADRHAVSPAAVALAWTLRPQPVDWVTLVKASNPAHMRDNVAAMHLTLEDDDLAALDRAFPPAEEDMKLVAF